MTIRRITVPERFVGTSRDAKPEASDGVNEGSTFYELDTGKTSDFRSGRWVDRESDTPEWATAILTELVAQREVLEGILEELG